jgi:pimeloyl-ACP methyl ester carboxylesterase
MTTDIGSSPRAAASSEGVTLRAVHFRTPDGITLAGDLRVPEAAPLPAPAVLLSPPGPAAVVDQSMITLYADRLTRAGYVTLALDPRNLGLSGGSPRQHFDGHERLCDLQTATSYLAGLNATVDPARLGVFGVSAGAVFALALAAYDARIKAFVSVCGGFVSPRTLRETLGADAFDQQRQVAFAALQRYHLTGELEYLPVVTPDGTGAFLAGIEPHTSEPFDYYGTERGVSDRFENRVTALSLLCLINFDWLSPAEFVGSRAGLLIAGNDDVYVPLDGTRDAHSRLTGPKDLVIVDGANHIDFYDTEPYLSIASDAAQTWFAEHLT